MKAVQLSEFGGPEKLHYVEDAPEPAIGDDEVLIEASAASVNPIDFKLRSGAMKDIWPLPLPAILGVDVSGVVRAAGKDVSGIVPGDRVIAMTSGSYASLVKAKADAVAILPEGVDLIDAAALPLAVATGDELIRESCGLTAGQTVVITGATGAVGRAAVHAAKLLGANVIAGVRRHSIADAEALGVIAAIALEDAADVARIGTVDAVADTVGGDAAASLLGHIKPGGVFATAVQPPKDAALHPQVRVTFLHSHPDGARLRVFAEDVAKGSFALPIGRRLPLAEAAEAHRLAEKGGIGKVLLLVL